VSTSFHFAAEEGNAGEPITGQLSITSNAHKNSTPITLSHIVVHLEGGAHRIDITHQRDDGESDVQKSLIQNLSLRENQASKTGPSSYAAEADLSISPDQKILLEFPLIVREAGPVSVKSTTLTIKSDQFNLNYMSTPTDNDEQPVWWMSGPSGLRKRRLGREETSRVQILPRPPKMELHIPGADQQFYTDELVHLPIEVANMEDEETEATLEVRILSIDGGAEFTWSSSSTSESEEVGLPGHGIGTLSPTQRKVEAISFTAPSEPAEYIVEVKVLYHLFSDRETPVSRTYSVNLQFVRAFEANYDFVPRVHEDPWPTLFGISSLPTPEGDAAHGKKVNGTMQRWHLAARIASFATEPVLLRAVELAVTSISGGASVVTTKEKSLPASDSGTTQEDAIYEIKPSEQQPSSFILDITKTSLEDRRSTTLEMMLRITWQRRQQNTESSPPHSLSVVTSTLPITPLSIPNSEPRVLCTRSSIPAGLPMSLSDNVNADNGKERKGLELLNEANTLLLTYTLENPTTHFLTFDMSMESTDDFAFSGAKLRSLNLLPLSRETVAFRILPLVELAEKKGETGVWIDVKFRVVDRYFKKVLRVLPASQGVRDGKGGGLGVWIGL
jgi:hypothetical protein